MSHTTTAHGRVRPGMFPGIHFEPGDPAPVTPPAGPASTLQEAVAIVLQMRQQQDQDTQEFRNNWASANDRLSELETRLARPRAAGVAQASGELTPEMRAFDTWLRRDVRGLKPEEARLLATDSDVDGGYLVPVNMANAIIEKLIQFSPVRELANVMAISRGDTLEIPVEGSTEFAGGWVGERAARSETTSAKLAHVLITAHEMYANPFVTQKLLDDSSFDVEGWISRRLARRFAVVEGTAFISGTGVGQPEGILTNASITVRNSGNATTLTAAGLINAYHDLPEHYAKNATWLMKRATIGAVRLLTDGSGQYLWQAGLAAGQPGTLLGQPYREAIDMPAEGAGLKAALFGDFNEGYTIVDRQGAVMVRDPYTNKPKVEFYTTRRVGGAVVLPEAFVVCKCSA